MSWSWSVNMMMKCETCQQVTIYPNQDFFNGECEACHNMTEQQWYDYLIINEETIAESE